MKNILLIVTLSLIMASTASAQILLKNGRVHTVSGEIIENGNVLIGADGKIQTIDTVLLASPKMTVIDCKGKEITPGLVDANTTLGLVEIWAVKGSNDTNMGVKDDLIRSAFRAADAFNPNATAIPITRTGGVTSVASFPTGGLVAGQGVWVDLQDDSSFAQIVEPYVGMRIYAGESGARSTGGSRGGAMLMLRELYDDVSFYKKNAKNFDQNRSRTLAASRLDLIALEPTLSGKPVVFRAQRASDIIAILKFSETLGIKPIIEGGAEAWMVAEELAAKKVPVILNSMDNLPSRFESLGARSDSAHLLNKAGVPLILSAFQSHNVRLLRQYAGNAVRDGLDPNAALRAITLTPAESLGMAKTHGSLEVGKVANIVVWSGDPLELSSQVEHLFINGKDVSLDNRQERLFQKYKKLDRRASPPDMHPTAQSPAESQPLNM